jgi:hypothetical protein
MNFVAHFSFACPHYGNMYRNALTLLFEALELAVGVLYSVALNIYLNSNIGVFMVALAVCILRFISVSQNFMR